MYLAKGLSLAGCDVRILLSDDRSMDQLANEISPYAAVHRLPLTNTYQRRTRCLGASLDWRQQRRVQAFIEVYSPDIVHVNQQVAEDGLDLLLAARASGKPLISTIHITHSAKSLGARLGALRDFVAAGVLARVRPAVICVSDAAAAKLRARNGLYELDISTVHPTVPSTNASSLIKARADARRQWAVSQDEIVVGAVGRIEDQKNPIFLLDAFSEAAKILPNLKFVWIGDGSLRTTLELRARKMGLGDRVIIDGWRDDARVRMAGFDIFAMPSRYEGLPLALLEAMHSGLAICASDADGIVEAVTDGRDGVICRVESTNAWCDALCRLARSSELRASLGEAALNESLGAFSEEAQTLKIIYNYNKLIREAGKHKNR
ncbi:glycosyltransferase family 4 protein [Limibaculum sp. FT325]|nr:glycosyltransferase family 4 protein [Limibaculum sediminis]